MQFGLYVRVLDFQPYRVGGSIPSMSNFFLFISEDKAFATKFLSPNVSIY